MEVKNYANLSLETLLIEEKKLNKNKIISAFIIGFLIAPIIYCIVKQTFSWVSFLILGILIYFVHKNSLVNKENLKIVQAEILKKKSGQSHLIKN